ncbi:GIY-YIG nuclease family protein [Candidatus Peribacteria bacterium]|nr:GIY-YIG nuclease family protein [Candidatus Peribacteria bacterium]
MTNPNQKIYAHIPSCPGVYLMKNKEDIIIYIGKSNNLRSRVKSYFVKNASLNFAKKKMVKVVEKIDYIETKSDLEALMLETNLIKKNQPKYNVLMKDGKNLSYIKITDDAIPCLIRTRIKTKHGEYFGPYSQYFDTRSYVRFIRKLFQLGNHEKIEKFGPPCMDTYINLCP